MGEVRSIVTGIIEMSCDRCGKYLGSVQVSEKGTYTTLGSRLKMELIDDTTGKVVHQLKDDTLLCNTCYGKRLSELKAILHREGFKDF